MEKKKWPDKGKNDGKCPECGEYLAQPPCDECGWEPEDWSTEKWEKMFGGKKK